MNVAIAEDAVKRYYATVSQQQIAEAQATLTRGDTADNNAGQPDDPVQFYRACTDERRQLLNQTLFHRLYLADDRITDHEPWPATPLT